MSYRILDEQYGWDALESKHSNTHKDWEGVHTNGVVHLHNTSCGEKNTTTRTVSQFRKSVQQIVLCAHAVDVDAFVRASLPCARKQFVLYRRNLGMCPGDRAVNLSGTFKSGKQYLYVHTESRATSIKFESMSCESWCAPDVYVYLVKAASPCAIIPENSEHQKSAKPRK